MTYSLTLQTPTRVSKAETVTLPTPQLLAVPVLIGDCATPLAGETVLSLLWRRLDNTDEEDAV